MQSYCQCTKNSTLQTPVLEADHTPQVLNGLST